MRRRYQSKSTESPKASIVKSSIPGFVAVISTFNRDFVDELKESIPHPHRQWNPTDKMWNISETYLEELVKILTRYYGEDVSTNLVEQKSDNLFKQVFDILPNDFVDKVFFALAQALHPDHGGTNGMMTQLNSAYEERKK